MKKLVHLLKSIAISIGLVVAMFVVTAIIPSWFVYVISFIVFAFIITIVYTILPDRFDENL